MIERFTFQQLKDFILNSNDETLIDSKSRNHTLLGQYATFRSGTLPQASGYFTASVKTIVDRWSYCTYASNEIEVAQLVARSVNCQNFKDVKELLNTPMELTKDQRYVLEIANKTYDDGEVHLDRAILLANSVLSPEFRQEIVYVSDARNGERIQMYDHTQHHYDIFTGSYWGRDNKFINVIRKDGRFFRGHRDYVSEEICFYCEHSKEWYYIKDFTRIICEGDVLCLEKNVGRVHLWPSDNRYHYDPIDTGVAPVPLQRIGVSSYHYGMRPDWWKGAQGIGMELEINCNDRDKLAQKISLDIVTERDGSLHENKGIELIGGPYSCKDYQDGKTPWKETVEYAKHIGAEGHDAKGGSNLYGIHLSISRSLFSTLHAAKFIVFFNQQSSLVKLVAQRGVIYHGNYGLRPDIKTTVTEKLDLDAYDHVDKRCKKKKKTIQTGKYEPVFADEKRLEVRVFRSNLRWDRILKNIEFVQAVFDFTRDCGISIIADAKKGTTEFLNWLQLQNDFKTLKEFLYETKNRKPFVIENTEDINNKLLETFVFKPKTPQPTETEQ